MADTKLLHVRISAGYRGYPDVLRRLEIEVGVGEVVGLVDAVGVGKTILPLAVTRLLEERGGTVKGYLGFRGRNLMELDSRGMKAVRGREIAVMSPISQAPLDPGMMLGAQIMEAWRTSCSGKGNDIRPDLPELMRLVRLPVNPEFLEKYPAELTIDQLCRVRIAMAIVHKPALLVADDPTKGLDPITKLEILDLLFDLSQKLRMGILCLSRDVFSIAPICHRVAVFKNGEIVETGTPEAVMESFQQASAQRLAAAPGKRPMALTKGAAVA